MRQKVADKHGQDPLWLSDALARIEQQFALVATLAPGTVAHKRATGVLLILQDSLHAMSEAQTIIEKVRRRREREQSEVE